MPPRQASSSRDRGAPRGRFLNQKRALIASAVAPPLIVSSVGLFAGSVLAAATPTTFQRAVDMADNVVRNGCASASVVQVGSNVRFGGTTFTRVRPGTTDTCATASTSPALYLSAFVSSYKNGAYCGANQTTNSGATSGVTVYTTCSLTYGVPNQAISRPGWYKGSNCAPGDNCSNGYTSGNSVQITTYII